MRILLAALFLIVAVPGAIACETGGNQQALTTEDGVATSVFASVERIEISKPFSLILHFCDGNAAEAVTVDAEMPAHRHGMNYVPEVRRLDDTRFAVSGMVFHMPGAWRIAVTRSVGVGKDAGKETLWLPITAE